MEESAWCSKCRTLKIDCSLSRRRHRKTWSEVIGNDFRKRKVSTDLAENRNASKSFIGKHPTYGWKHGN